MTITPEKTSSASYRGALIAIGVVTAALSAWWLAGEILRSDPPTAARTGMVRGELWLYGGLATSGSSEASTAAAGREALVHSLSLAPTSSRAWLALALATERFGWMDRRSSAALKMSYYTGFNTSALIAPRLALLARTDSEGDPELDDILRRQIRLIVTRAPEFKTAIIAAYGTATPANRKIIEIELTELDTALLEQLRHR